MASYTITGTATGTAVLGGTWDLHVLSSTPVVGTEAVSYTAISAGRFISGTGTGLAVVSGTFDGQLSITGRIVVTPVLTGGLRISAKILNRAIISAAELSGSLVRLAQPAEGAEASYEATGIRTSIPLLVFAQNVLIPTDTSGVPAGGSFIVSASYIGVGGSSMYEAGAAPNAIGTRIVPTIGAPYLVFRAPVLEEVVWDVASDGLFRFHLNRDTGTYGWVKYLSWPERAVAGQYVFDIFDPDGIYKYYSRILGAVMYEWSYDSRVLLNFYDSSEVSHFFLAGLAANYGLELDAQEPLLVRRAKTKSAVESFKLKGLDKAIRLRLRALGYLGYAQEIWVNPTDATNFQSTVLNAFGTVSSSPKGANISGKTKEYPHGYRVDDGSGDGFYPSSRLSVHINDSAGNTINITTDIKNTVANDLMNDVLPAHVDVRWFVTDFSVAKDKVDITDSLVISHV